MSEPTIAELQEQLEAARGEITKLQNDKAFLLEDANGLRELNKGLEADLDASLSERVNQVLAMQDAVGLAVFGAPHVTAILQDYSRLGDFLVRTGKIPQETKTGEIFAALSAAEMSRMKDSGELVATPMPGASAPAPQPPPPPFTIEPPAPPQSPVVESAAPPEALSAPLTPPSGPNSGPTVRPIQAPPGGWMAQPRLG